MDAVKKLSTRRESDDGYDTITVSRPGIDNALSITDRLFDTNNGEDSSSFSIINRNTSYANSFNIQLGLSSNFAEDGAEPAPYAPPLLQPDTDAGDLWPVNDQVMGYGSWTQQSLATLDGSQTSSDLSELATTQTPLRIYHTYEDPSEDNSLLSIPIGYNYGDFFCQPDGNSQFNPFNWVPEEQSSEVTGVDSESTYGASESQASHTDISTPITNSDQPRRFLCNCCNKAFQSGKDLKRHNETKTHRKKSPSLPDRDYVCRCGYSQNRKDLYKRHSGKCTLKKRLHSKYACKCGSLIQDKDEHWNHVKHCGKGRPGRPRNSIAQ